MSYQYNSNIYLKEVVLNVNNLKAQEKFYTEILGLSVLDELDNNILLGVGKERLVRLIKSKVTDNQKSYGLYHLAILLPSRQDLSNIFRRLMNLKIDLVGGSDHGYSEAIYLEDIEGNGIEIYVDKDVSKWDIRENGNIAGVTEPLEAQEMYNNGIIEAPYKMPEGTRMGHIHLSVRSSKESSELYQNLLGIDEKFSLPGASWLASGEYHHHLAFNNWSKENLDNRNNSHIGLKHFVVEIDSKEYLDSILQSSKDYNLTINLIDENTVEVVDFDGIAMRIVFK